MSKLSELTVHLSAVDARLDKIAVDTQAQKKMIEELQAKLEDTELPEGVDELLDRIQQKAQQIDDQVADPTTDPTDPTDPAVARRK